MVVALFLSATRRSHSLLLTFMLIDRHLLIDKHLWQHLIKPTCEIDSNGVTNRITSSYTLWNVAFFAVSFLIILLSEVMICKFDKNVKTMRRNSENI